MRVSKHLPSFSFNWESCQRFKVKCSTWKTKQYKFNKFAAVSAFWKKKENANNDGVDEWLHASNVRHGSCWCAHANDSFAIHRLLSKQLGSCQLTFKEILSKNCMNTLEILPIKRSCIYVAKFNYLTTSFKSPFLHVSICVLFTEEDVGIQSIPFLVLVCHAFSKNWRIT